MTKLVVVSYVLFAAAPLAIAASHHSFWERAHSTAPVAALVFLAVLAALVLGRRWAWLLLVLFEGFVLLSFMWDFTDVLSLVLVLLSFLLLVSPPMRTHVSRRRPVFVRRHS